MRNFCDKILQRVFHNKRLNSKELHRIATTVLHRNSIILMDLNRRAEKHEVNLHWWDCYCKSSCDSDYNLGDYLSNVVLRYMMEYYGIPSMAGKDKKKYHLYCIGSIIDGGYQDAVIWGSGILHDKMFWWKRFRKLDVRSVRGPLSRSILLKNGYECPEIYGDPAILMPCIYTPSSREKKYKYTVVGHWSAAQEEYSQDVHLLNIITSDYKFFIDELCQSEKVISGSLHGIILAEAYGIPAIFLHQNELDLSKYKDYYFSTGRENFPIARSIEEALSTNCPSIPDFYKMRENLIAVFPTDIFAL